MNDKKFDEFGCGQHTHLAASMVEKAKSGHPGGAMGGADFINVLFSEFLVYDPENPSWEVATAFPRPWAHVAHAILGLGAARKVYD